MNAEAIKFSEHCNMIIYGVYQSEYDDYRVKNNLPQQPVQFVTKEEKDAIRDQH